MKSQKHILFLFKENGGFQMIIKDDVGEVKTCYRFLKILFEYHLRNETTSGESYKKC